MGKPGIYIHIPFCRKKCNYCDFYLITNTNILERYIENLKTEMKLQSGTYKNEKFDSIFIGGGTPSLLSPEQMNEIISTVKNNFDFQNENEITIEANPDDFKGEDKFRMYKEVGINRISFGVQSFNDEELKFLTREHTSEQAYAVIEKAKKYFDNISIDLIYSLPNQVISNLERTLEKVIQLEIPHISAYTLIYEKETPIYNMMNKKKISKNDDKLESELYLMFSEKLSENGYEHYEVSNYARKGYESKHNLKYWEYENYIGFGPSAHSYFNGKRWNNFRNIIKYNIRLQKSELPFDYMHILTEKEMKIEFIMLGLRSRGVNLDNYYNLFGKKFEEEYEAGINDITSENLGYYNNGLYSLTEKGYLMADEICARYF
jgi:oxygen-independent coproporphyrinogen III oxidase